MDVRVSDDARKALKNMGFSNYVIDAIASMPKGSEKKSDPEMMKDLCEAMIPKSFGQGPVHEFLMGQCVRKFLRLSSEVRHDVETACAIIDQNKESHEIYSEDQKNKSSSSWFSFK